MTSTTKLPARVRAHLKQVSQHVYINPLEKCNLKCKICYTRKTDPILSAAEIQDFLARYQKVQSIQTVTFCGGEVFALAYFPGLVNALTAQGIFVQVITNGTIDRLAEFTHPELVNLITSLDGVEAYHDQNRGVGNFRKSITFLQKAKKLGFHTDIFSIVTRQNLPRIDEFETALVAELGEGHTITYHPRKPPAYLTVHPVSNIVGETEGFDFLTPAEMREIMQTRNVFPPMQLGCYQVALASDGKVYGCCEGTVPIGHILDDPAQLLKQLEVRLHEWAATSPTANCLGCTQSHFMCGIKSYLQEIQEVQRASFVE